MARFVKLHEEETPALRTITNGTFQVLGGKVTFRKAGDSYTIDRIEVDDDKRRTGEATRILQAVANLAKKQRVNLNASISPDDDDYEVTLGLRRAFNKAGFASLNLDGDVYPNEVELIVVPE